MQPEEGKLLAGIDSQIGSYMLLHKKRCEAFISPLHWCTHLEKQKKPAEHQRTIFYTWNVI